MGSSPSREEKVRKLMENFAKIYVDKCVEINGKSSSTTQNIVVINRYQHLLLYLIPHTPSDFYGKTHRIVDISTWHFAYHYGDKRYDDCPYDALFGSLYKLFGLLNDTYHYMYDINVPCYELNNIIREYAQIHIDKCNEIQREYVENEMELVTKKVGEYSAENETQIKQQIADNESKFKTATPHAKQMLMNENIKLVEQLAQFIDIDKKLEILKNGCETVAKQLAGLNLLIALMEYDAPDIPDEKVTAESVKSNVTVIEPKNSENVL